MQILKHGNFSAHKFECRVCGCVFRADPGEFTVRENMLGGVFECHCPECGNYINDQIYGELTEEDRRWNLTD